MLAWSEGTSITDVRKTRNHGYDVIVGGELFTDYSDHPRKLVTLNPKLKSAAPDATSFFPVGGMPTVSSLAWKTFRKVRTLWHCSRLRSMALYLWLDLISVRQSTVAAISGLQFAVGAVMVSSSIRLTAWLQNSKKRAERSERLNRWAESPRLSPTGYLHHRLPVMGC